MDHIAVQASKQWCSTFFIFNVTEKIQYQYVILMVFQTEGDNS